ncbi:MAG TPA: septum formation initiator family protein [Chthoniobacterales bacterium]
MSEAAGFQDFRKRKERSALQVLNRFLVILIILIVVCGLIAAFLPALKARSEQRAALEKIRAEVTAAKTVFQSRSKELQRLKTDPDYLGDIARDKLNVQKEGETIFRFDSAGATPTSTPVK